MLTLFACFAQIGLLSIGGGYAAIPLIQALVVSAHGWLTGEQFLDLATIAEMTPGPIVINAATFVGLRVGGLVGAVTATLGSILPSLMIVSLLSLIYRKYRALPLLQSVLQGMRPAVVALIASAGFRMFLQVALPDGTFSFSGVDWLRAGLFAAAFVALRRLKPNPIWVMAACGAVGLAVGLLTGV